MQSVPFVCPPIYLYSSLTFEPSDLWPYPFACIWVMIIALVGLKVKIRISVWNAVSGTSVLNRGQFSSSDCCYWWAEVNFNLLQGWHISASQNKWIGPRRKPLTCSLSCSTILILEKAKPWICRCICFCCIAADVSALMLDVRQAVRH